MLNDEIHRESNIDDVLQVSNIFVNVSKGEVAKTNDLQKAFNTVEIGDIVREVRLILKPTYPKYHTLLFMNDLGSLSSDIKKR